MSENDRGKLEHIQAHLEYYNNLKTIRNIHGEHFEDCVWANENNTEGPDTCPCYYKHQVNKQAEEEARNLINFYNLIKCKNCVFNKM